MGPLAWKRLANCLTKKTLPRRMRQSSACVRTRLRFLQEHLPIATHLIAFARTCSVSVAFVGVSDPLVARRSVNTKLIKCMANTHPLSGQSIEIYLWGFRNMLEIITIVANVSRTYSMLEAYGLYNKHISI